MALTRHPLLHSGEWNSQTFHMNSADELPASTRSKDVTGIKWFWRFKVLHCGFEEAIQGLLSVELKIFLLAREISLLSVKVGYRKTAVFSESKRRYLYPRSALPSFVFVCVNHPDYSPHDAFLLPKLYYLVNS